MAPTEVVGAQVKASIRARQADAKQKALDLLLTQIQHGNGGWQTHQLAGDLLVDLQTYETAITHYELAYEQAAGVMVLQGCAATWKNIEKDKTFKGPGRAYVAVFSVAESMPLTSTVEQVRLLPASMGSVRSFQLETASYNQWGLK